MVEREEYASTHLMSVIDIDDIYDIVLLFDDEEKSKEIVERCVQYGKDRRPFVAFIDFYGENCYLSFGYRCDDLAPGDNGETTYFENVNKIFVYENDTLVIYEQVCWKNFLSLLKFLDKTLIKV